MTRPLLLDRMNTPPRVAPTGKPPLPLVTNKAREAFNTIAALLIVCAMFVGFAAAMDFVQRGPTVQQSLKVQTVADAASKTVVHSAKKVRRR